MKSAPFRLSAFFFGVSPIRNKLIPSYRDIEYYKDERWMNCKEWMNDYMVDLARIGFTAQLSSTGLDGVDLLAHIAKHNQDQVSHHTFQG